MKQITLKRMNHDTPNKWQVLCVANDGHTYANFFNEPFRRAQKLAKGLASLHQCRVDLFNL